MQAKSAHLLATNSVWQARKEMSHFSSCQKHTQTYCHDTMMTQVERREFVCSYGAVTHTHTHTHTHIHTVTPVRTVILCPLH